MNVYPCKILYRVNRFVVRLEIRNVEIDAHLTNTGRLHDVLVDNRKYLVKKINSNKLKYRLISVLDGDGYYSVIDTITQNIGFTHTVEKNLIPKLKGCILIKKNPKINSSSLDFLYRCNNYNVLIETKSAVLRRESNEAMYPDCPTIRGRRHIMESINLQRRGLSRC